MATAPGESESHLALLRLETPLHLEVSSKELQNGQPALPRNAAHPPSNAQHAGEVKEPHLGPFVHKISKTQAPTVHPFLSSGCQIRGIRLPLAQIREDGEGGIWQSLIPLCEQVWDSSYPLPAVPEAPSLSPVQEPRLWPASEGCTSSYCSETSKRQGILHGAGRRGAAASKESPEQGKGEQLGHEPRSGPVCMTQPKKYLSKLIAYTKE